VRGLAVDRAGRCHWGHLQGARGETSTHLLAYILGWIQKNCTGGVLHGCPCHSLYFLAQYSTVSAAYPANQSAPLEESRADFLPQPRQSGHASIVGQSLHRDHAPRPLLAPEPQWPARCSHVRRHQFRQSSEQANFPIFCPRLCNPVAARCPNQRSQSVTAKAPTKLMSPSALLPRAAAAHGTKSARGQAYVSQVPPFVHLLTRDSIALTCAQAHGCL
jgi:hypothetical protein